MARKKAASKSRSKDAVALLMDDHKKVKQMFKKFEKLKDPDQKSALVRQICSELTVHTSIEEEIFYPAVREAIDEEDMMDEADVEHAGAKSLIAQLERMKPGDDHYDAKVTVLGEYIDHHVQEEHEEMFPKARKAKIDLATLGENMAARKKELQAKPAARGFRLFS